jgi:4-hydroxybenzoate polyprenyltransferase
MIMAYATILGYIPAFAWFVYGAAVVWTLVYDTEYALADLPDDIKLGLYSSARMFGRGVLFAIALLQIVFLAMMWFVGYHYALSWLYDIGLIGAALCFVYQYYLMRHHHYFRAFAHNQWVGLLIFLGVVVSLS